ncbi:MAG TPA: hypothetical protein VGL18_13835 [Actinomycetota bacterium]
MRAGVAVSVMVVALTACTNVPAAHEASVPRTVFAVHHLPPSPSPLRTEVRAGSVQALIPDGWIAQPLPTARYPQEGFVASPRLEQWESAAGSVGGMEAFWIDVAKLQIPSDYYYMVAQGPAMAALAANKNCRSASEEIYIDHPPDFTGRRFSPGDYVMSATGTCRTQGKPTRWAYVVAAPGFGPMRQMGIPTSGLYVVIAVVPGKRAGQLLKQILEAARFGDTSISDFLQAARNTR